MAYNVASNIASSHKFSLNNTTNNSTFHNTNTSHRVVRVLLYNDWGASWEALEPLALAFGKDTSFEVIVLAMTSGISNNTPHNLNATTSLQNFCDKTQNNIYYLADIKNIHTDYAKAIDILCEKSRIVSEAIAKDRFESQFVNTFAGRFVCIVGFDENLTTYITPKDCKAHYCFTTRPYSDLRPTSWQNRHIAMVSKLCYVEYGAYAFSIHEEDIAAYYKGYLRYYDYLFAPTTFHAQVAESKQSDESLLTIVVAGCPRFDELVAESKNIKTTQEYFTSHFSPNNPSNQKKLRVLYVPRWAIYDPHSTFISYISTLLDRAKAGDFYLHFRAHPNLYQYVVKEEQAMTQDEWEYLQQEIEKYGLWDDNPSVLQSFANADVIISDTSSMLIYAFLSGKPTIYTQGSWSAEVNSWALRILQGCFIAKDKHILLQYLQELSTNYAQTFAPKRAVRSNILAQDVFIPEGGSAQYITSLLLQDYTKSIAHKERE